MNKHEHDNIFTLLNDMENLLIETQSGENNFSPGKKKQGSPAFEDDFFRSSSLDYFRESCMSISSNNLFQDINGKNVHKVLKLTSKNSFIKKDFDILSTIGEGAYAKVYKIKHIESNQIYAMKVIEKRLLEKEEKLYQVYVENEILNICNHPNIINIYGAFEDNEYVYMVLEYCSMGDLAEFINQNGIRYMLINKY
jgi:hypothetical protein